MCIRDRVSDVGVHVSIRKYVANEYIGRTACRRGSVGKAVSQRVGENLTVKFDHVKIEQVLAGQLGFLICVKGIHQSTELSQIRSTQSQTRMRLGHVHGANYNQVAHPC